MTDYSELVEALRCCDKYALCNDCPIFETCDGDVDKAMAIAADAIEELDAEETRLLLITSELQDKVVELEEQLNDAEIAADDNGRQVEALQAEIKRLKEANDELREAQTYINHYGDRWRTSAKDVPTAAYKHGYADGMAEVKAQLPKRGEWIWIQKENGGQYKGCSVCHAPIPTDSMLDYLDDEDCDFCYSCGAKMEVQDGV